MDPLSIVLILVVVAGFGIFIFYQQQNTQKLKEELLDVTKSQDKPKNAEAEAQNIILKAEKKASEIVNNAQKKAREVEKRTEERETALEKRERKQLEMSNSIAHRLEEIEKKENSLDQAKQDVRKRSQEITQKLEEIAGMSQKKAEKLLKEEVEKELQNYVSKKIHDAEQTVQMEADDRARDILVNAMQSSAVDYVAETTSTTFQIEDENLKGKIIGKEGRNIRTFERMTGVDIIVDEAPDLVTVSSFDPIRREVAALAIQKLLKDGRVHPGSIEETIKHIKSDLAKEIRKSGDKIAYDAGFPDLPDEIKKLLGRFKYRFSYGQNLAKHSLEMVKIGQQLAQAVGADVELVKKACLLHDIGKVLTYEIEGKPHHHISGDIIRKYLKDEKLANAVEAHHGDIESKSIEAELVAIADSISGSRPGARRDSYDDYVKRVKALEDIAKQYKAVDEAYAIHAGREVRVIVSPKVIDDEETNILAHNIAKEIEDKENYPGTVRVTVIRELRVQTEAQ